MKTLWLLVFLMASLLVPTATPQAQAQTLDKAYVVALGGWWSCPRSGLVVRTPGWYLRAQQRLLTQQLADAGVDVEWLEACLPGGTPAAGSSLSYRTSTGYYGQVQYGALHQVIARYAGDRQVFVIGHSFGGWVAPETSARLVNAGGKLGGLYTLEAIDARSCLPRYQIGRRRHSACLRGPLFASSVHQSIAGSGATWLNLYLSSNRTRGLKLHSGAVASPAQNYTFDINTARGNFTNHHMFGFNYSPWHMVCKDVFARLNTPLTETSCRFYSATDVFGRP